jgi:Na+-driven multidrug efflux pump
MVSLGCQQASSTLIGQEIGRNDVNSAKEYYRIILNVSFYILSGFSLLVFAYNKELMNLFIDENDIENNDLE